MGDAPSGTVTFLFTDIEDSSRLWDEHPVAMRAALEEHDALVAGAIAANGGYVFTTAGDSFAVAFQTADAAAQASLDIQACVRAADWDEATPIEVRIGLHTGEAHERGGDYFGPAVNRAARIEAAGRGGQILVSDVTARVLAGSTVTQWELLDLGEHSLKGLTRREHIHQLGTSDFGPLRTMSSAARNPLPHVRSGFVGRRQELDRVERDVRDHRLVVLTGVGGVGKTRLAIEAAARARDAFAGGVEFVDLSAVTASDAVTSAFASLLGIEPRPDRSLMRSIIEVLDQSSSLVVMDNCEHVIDVAAELVDEVLAGTSTTHFLCTSRETLGIDGEVTVHVMPHPVDDPGADGVQLFLDRARAVAPDADLSDVAAITELCSKLDGIALALELAAARTRVMSVGEIASRLGDRFRVLGRRRRSAERHQTLRSTVAWSFELLEPDELDVVCRCAVFAGGFDLESAAALNPDVDELDLVEILDGLVRKSLVTVRPGRSSRYSMLETIRQYAEDELSRRDQFESAADAHAAFFARKARDQHALWPTPRQALTYEWLRRELPNARVAFNWALDAGQLDHASDIAIGCFVIGIYMLENDCMSWIEKLLDVDGIESHASYLDLLVAGTHSAFGDYESCADRAEAALAVAAATGVQELPPQPCGRTLVTMALALAGRPRSTEQANIVRRTRDPMFLPTLIIHDVRNGLAQHMDLVKACEDAIAAADAADHPRARAIAATAAAWVHADSDWDLAVRYAEDAMAISEASQNRLSEAGALDVLAYLHAMRDEARGLELYADSFEALFAVDSANVKLGLADVAAHLARVGHDEPAAVLLGAAYWPYRVKSTRQAEVDLRHRLGDDEFDRLHERGRQMSLGETRAHFGEAIEARLAELRTDPERTKPPP